MKTDSKNLTVLIKVNGEDKLVPQNTSIVELLEMYKINQSRVVIELNKQILRKDLFETTLLNKNDLLEIVTFVGGG